MGAGGQAEIMPEVILAQAGPRDAFGQCHYGGILRGAGARQQQGRQVSILFLAFARTGAGSPGLPAGRNQGKGVGRAQHVRLPEARS